MRLRKGGYKMHHGFPQGEAQYLLDPSSACPSLLLPRARNLPIPGGEGSQHFRLLHFLSWLGGEARRGNPKISAHKAESQSIAPKKGKTAGLSLGRGCEVRDESQRSTQ